MLESSRTDEAQPLLEAVYQADARDTNFLLTIATLQAWLKQNTQLAKTCRRALAQAHDTKDCYTAERTAKVCSLQAMPDREIHDSALVLARGAVTLAQDSAQLSWSQMTLGMAAYRSGNYEESELACKAASKLDPNSTHVSGTAAFYRAMCLVHLGKLAEARDLAINAAAGIKAQPVDVKNPLSGIGDDEDDMILWMARNEALDLIEMETETTHQSIQPINTSIAPPSGR
jgi:tetratricopeptide (TPR) repeat protein